MVSVEFLARLKLSDTPAYRLCGDVGASPSWLSQVIHGAITVQPGDRRLLLIGKRLGLQPSEVFNPVPAPVAK
jgi:hypothetical protein